MKKLLIIIIILINGLTGQEKGQTTDEKVNSIMPGDSRFLLRGYAHSGFEAYDGNTSFVGGSFNPIFLWQQSKQLIFESELEMELEDGKTHIALEYANMSYVISNQAIIRLGYFLLPFGTFSERIHPRWINRMSSNPLGFGHDPIGPGRDMGLEIRGGYYLGKTKLIYSTYITNGPSLNDGTNPELETEEAGMLVYNNFQDQNKNKAVGGRVGFFPISDLSLELGLSGQYAKVGNDGSAYEDIGATMFAGDLSYVKNISLLKGIVDIKGQYNYIKVDQADYISPEDNSVYTFENISQAYYLQLAYRTAYMKSDFIKHFEFVGRYSGMELPEGSLWESHQNQIAFGINYWIDFRSVIKFSYQITEKEGGHEVGPTGKEKENALFVHWAFGF